jgi:hypothetical protein
MDDEVVKNLLELREANETLMTETGAAIHAMEKWDGISEERKKSMIAPLKKIMAQNEEMQKLIAQSLAERESYLENYNNETHKRAHSQ